MNKQSPKHSKTRRAGSPERSAGLPAGSNEPDPEVDAHPTRRVFTAEYKLRIVREADVCREVGEVGALLRREGLYSSLLTVWRRELRLYGVEGMAAKRRGPEPKAKLQEREIELEQKLRKLELKVAQQAAIIEFQKKVHELLGIPLKQLELGESDS